MPPPSTNGGGRVHGLVLTDRSPTLHSPEPTPVPPTPPVELGTPTDTYTSVLLNRWQTIASLLRLMQG